MKVRFFTQPRDGKISVWVESYGALAESLSGGDAHNVWDLTYEELTPAVRDAIQHSFELGVRFHESQVRKALDTGVVTKDEWLNEKGEVYA